MWTVKDWVFIFVAGGFGFALFGFGLALIATAISMLRRD